MTIYAFIASLWLILSLRVLFHFSFILFAPLSIFIVFILTWKYTDVEYEYSFEAGTVTFSKIYGKSRRKTVLSFDIKSVVEVFPYNEHTAHKTAGYSISDGVDTYAAHNPCICVFEDQKKQKNYFLFDCDEQSAKIFKYFNPSTTDRTIFDKLK